MKKNTGLVYSWMLCLLIGFSNSSIGQLNQETHEHSCKFPVYEKNGREHEIPVTIPDGVDVWKLESNPGAVAVIYLDFDGYVIPATSNWSNGSTITCAPSTNTNEEMYETWQIVAEDFRPFNINVTTLESVFNSVPISKRQRVVITPTKSWYSNSVGGVAGPSSFRLNDNACFSFNQGGVGAGSTSSHEVGHTLGLSHDGRTSPQEGYYAGHGNFSPIMGGGFLHYEVWSKGEYNKANNYEDDLSKISNNLNGFGYRADDHENTIAMATPLLADNDGNLLDGYNEGIIETGSDVDVFQFYSVGNPIKIELEVATPTNNLDPLVRLLDANGGLINVYNPEDSYDILIQENLPQGTYYIEVDGVGLLDPIQNGYSDYSSLGYYNLKGSLNYNNQTTFEPFINIINPVANVGIDLNVVTQINFEVVADDFDGSITSCLFKINGQGLSPVKNGNTYTLNYPIQILGNYMFEVLALNNEGKLISKTINFPVLPIDPVQFNRITPSTQQDFYMKDFKEIDFAFEFLNYQGNINSATLNIGNSQITLDSKGGTYTTGWLPNGYGQFDYWVTLEDAKGITTSSTYSLTLIEPCDQIISKSNWSPISFTSEETTNGNYVFDHLIDDDTLTHWSTQWELSESWPYEFQIDLGEEHEISGVSLFGNQNFHVQSLWFSAYDVEFFVSNSTNNWGASVHRGTYEFHKSERINSFFNKKSGRYLKGIIHSTQYQPGGWAYLSELDVFGNCDLSVNTENARSESVQTLVYPNPVQGDLNIEIMDAESSDLNISVTNLKGQLIKKYTFKLNTTKSVNKINCSDLSPGMYLIDISTKEGTQQHKIVVK